MKKKIIVLVIVLLFLSCSCSKQTEDIEGNGKEQIDLESVEDGKENNQDNEVIIFDEDGQYLELYLEEKPWMYIANIKGIPEFDNPKYKEFSGEILEISDTRLIEIANYFYRIFNDKSFECMCLKVV
ncbi:MAG: hypothetical protein MJA31_16720 [Clostridia bacterium]|nr:hypothetical protein [Clostridia bacterium]